MGSIPVGGTNSFTRSIGFAHRNMRHCSSLDSLASRAATAAVSADEAVSYRHKGSAG
jgi:hypothetical protein